MTYRMLHQKEGTQALKDNPRFLLADEAGLGKTLQVLDAAPEFLEKRDMLVLTPTSTVENWKEEARKWDFPLRKLVVVGYEKQLLISYKELLRRKWGVLVFDEAHFLKNWGAQRTKLVRQLIKGRDSRMWFLTGTPVIKGAQDLHPLLSFIQPGEWGKYKHFCEKFCKTKPNQWKPNGIEYHGIKNASILNARIKDIMLRRYKKDEVKDMPDKIFSNVPFDIGSGNFDVFTSVGIIRAITTAVERGGTIGLDEEVVETIQQLGLKKVDSVVQFCADTLFPHPLVIFAHHRLVIYDIAEKLRSFGRKVEVLIGGMDREKKQKIINDFQAGRIDDLVCSIGVAGVGINLFRSSRCVFAEFPWTWAALEQAADRLHRIGQKNCVNIYNCFAKNTFEEKQLRLIEERKNIAEQVLG